MNAAMIGDPARPPAADRRPMQAQTQMPTQVQAQAPTQAQAQAAAALATAPDGADELPVAALGLLFGNQPAARRAAQRRLSALLDDWIVGECRSLIDARLSGLADAARTAMLPSAPARATLAHAVLGALSPPTLVGLLSAEAEAERGVLLHQAAGPDPMLRESALDALGGLQRTGPVPERVRQGCLALLEPGFVLLGADRSPARSATAPADASGSGATREAAMLAALRRGDPEGTIALLALHATVDPALVADAAWLRDSRSLFGMAWRAGYSTRTAILLQSQLAGIPRQAATAPAENGISPMDRSAIAWQLAMLGGR